MPQAKSSHLCLYHQYSQSLCYVRNTTILSTLEVLDSASVKFHTVTYLPTIHLTFARALFHVNLVLHYRYAQSHLPRRDLSRPDFLDKLFSTSSKSYFCNHGIVWKGPHESAWLHSDVSLGTESMPDLVFGKGQGHRPCVGRSGEFCAYWHSCCWFEILVYSNGSWCTGILLS